MILKGHRAAINSSTLTVKLNLKCHDAREQQVKYLYRANLRELLSKMTLSTNKAAMRALTGGVWCSA
jgi:hypothetical protein